MRFVVRVFCGLWLAACATENDDGDKGDGQAVATPMRPGPDVKTMPRTLARAGSPRINAAGLKIIEDSEGLKLEAYELAGQWLIGYGHSAGVKPGMTISAAQAEKFLRKDLRETEDAIERVVSVPLNDNEFSALVSLAYNLGVTGFMRTLVYERLEAGDRPGAADAFAFLDSAVVDGETREFSALKERREQERALFLSPVTGRADTVSW